MSFGIRCKPMWIASGALALLAAASGAVAQEVTVLCNFEVDWCESLKAAY